MDVHRQCLLLRSVVMTQAVRDGQPLVQFLCCIRRIFIKKAPFVFLVQAGYACNAFIRNTFQTGPFQSPLPFFCRELFDWLCDNKRALSHMVEFPVCF